jgi:hypothetical protein
MESLWPGFFQAKYLNLKHLLPFWPEFIQAMPSQRFVWIFSTILFTFVRTFWIGFIQDKTAITF